MWLILAPKGQWHTGHTREPLSKEGLGISPYNWGVEEGNPLQLQPQDSEWGLPSHPEDCQAGLRADQS